MPVDDDKFEQWHAAEREAEQAEMKIAAIGQAAPDPRMVALIADAKEKRERADALLRELVRQSQEGLGE